MSFPIHVALRLKVAAGSGKLCVRLPPDYSAPGSCTTSSDVYYAAVFNKHVIFVAEPALGYEFERLVIDGKEFPSGSVTYLVKAGEVSAEAYFKRAGAPPPPAPKLSVDLRASPSSGRAPLTVTFTVRIAGGKPPYDVEIRYGDGDYNYKYGTSSTTVTFTHTYELKGLYTASVVVTDSSGNIASDTVNVNVETAPPITVKVVINVGVGGKAYVRVAGREYGWIYGGRSASFSVAQGTIVYLSATVNPGYEFEGWYVNGRLETGDPTLVRAIYSDTTISARFKSIGPRECKEGETRCIGYDLYECVGGRWKLVEKDSERCKYKPECEEGRTKCEGFDYYECRHGRWVLVERNSEKCGYKPRECEEGKTTCIGYNLYKCVNGKWVLWEANSPRCGYVPPPECHEGDTKCIGPDLYKCVNGEWVIWERNSPECAVPPKPECEEGATKCVNTDLYVCKGGRWVIAERDSEKCKKKEGMEKYMPLFVLGALLLGGAIIMSALR